MMDEVILSMLDQYQCKTDNEYENALKQIMQQVALLGLWRAKFFEHGAFYGGTSLRILYKLDRFSEDLDFSLLKKSLNFEIDGYLSSIQAELEAFGFSTEVVVKEKNIETNIQSGLVKANSQLHLLRVSAPPAIQQRCHSKKQLKIKLDIDTNPPDNFKTETKTLLQPIPFWVKTYCLPDLFAGKISALLCRQWQLRVKGRDWYDFLWFIQNRVPVHMKHLEARLRFFQFYTSAEPLSESKLKLFIDEKIDTINIDLAKQDINKFIKNPSRIDGWSRDVFHAAVGELMFS